ncbi:hypothetical protein Poly51_33420 [Rubripirellula tenax]|uniref:Uncharacterized protein n=1 Tax=Rubripirellula tenax TaxID=2528015 RepID=A0A5C6EYB1_9BACT|nr:hypothetical protein Poly51_33420 [Rubripirellula tenax]
MSPSFEGDLAQLSYRSLVRETLTVPIKKVQNLLRVVKSFPNAVRPVPALLVKSRIQKRFGIKFLRSFHDLLDRFVNVDRCQFVGFGKRLL